MNIINILKLVTLMGLLYSLFIIGYEAYFILQGGYVFWGHPLLPMSDWGKVNLYTRILVFASIFLSIFIIIKSIKKGRDER